MWRKRKIRKINFSVYFKIISFCLVALVIVVLILKTGLFNIKRVDVEAVNLSCAGTDQIKNFAGLLSENFFFINESKIQKNLKKKFICIKSADIKKIFPDKINLKIQNRQAIAILASLKNEASFSATPSAEDIKNSELMDNEGVIFGKADSNLNLPQIFIYGSRDNLWKVSKILEKIKTLGLIINKGRISDGVFVINSEPPVPEILFSLGNSIDVQLASLQLILDKAKIDGSKLEFIDLRFDKPVVKIAPKK